MHCSCRIAFLAVLLQCVCRVCCAVLRLLFAGCRYYVGGDVGSINFGNVDRAHIDLDGERLRPGLVVANNNNDAATAAAVAAAAAARKKAGSADCEKDVLRCFQYVPVTAQAFWTIEIVDLLVSYGGNGGAPTPTGICKAKRNGRCTAILDTGTYLIYAPKADIRSTLGNTMDIQSCDDLSRLPSLTFVLWVRPRPRPRAPLAAPLAARRLPRHLPRRLPGSSLCCCIVLWSFVVFARVRASVVR